jgi:hypothetical protein
MPPLATTGSAAPALRGARSGRRHGLAARRAGNPYTPGARRRHRRRDPRTPRGGRHGTRFPCSGRRCAPTPPAPASRAPPRPTLPSHALPGHVPRHRSPHVPPVRHHSPGLPGIQLPRSRPSRGALAPVARGIGGGECAAVGGLLPHDPCPCVAARTLPPACGLLVARVAAVDSGKFDCDHPHARVRRSAPHLPAQRPCSPTYRIQTAPYGWRSPSRRPTSAI